MSRIRAFAYPGWQANPNGKGAPPHPMANAILRASGSAEKARAPRKIAMSLLLAGLIEYVCENEKDAVHAAAK